MVEKDKQVQLKNYNRRSVLNYIRKNKTATKAGLSAASGLTFMAIKKILEELEGLNLIRCDEMEGVGVGRKAVSYAVNEVYRYTIGIHINKFVTSVALMNLRGDILQIKSYPMEEDMGSQYAFMDMLAGGVREVIAQAGIEREKILGIGVGVPGPLHAKADIVLTPSNIPMLRYLPLKEILEEKTGYRVFMQKDTNVIAFGEYWNGNTRDIYDLIYIDVDMGIGSGLIIDGRMNIGANGIAGEFGHIILDVNGPLCSCGNRGCLEAMSSGSAILKELRRQLETEQNHPLFERRDKLVIEDVFEMAGGKDLLAISILNQSAFYVGIAVANLINILDPRKIVLGGILIQRYPRYFDIVKDVANSHRPRGARENDMEISALGENAGVIGAGEVVADYFFSEEVNEVFVKNV